ncbi:LOW QUALITY PROTEIN: hypothetical protein PHMEG_00031859 [Phytophthora megakarya]|uniref:Uncharacterized protein n=1 Tax=Phytophthora megakarya TaxID=4795 RepID=A0A225UXN6_9STRA|nr:LOW QUALITY PROTEIN: hypothetical protein PHMEG_00031859 [Phytophthora megakarya]
MSNSDESPRASNAGGTLYRSYAASDSSSDESARELGPDDFFPNRCARPSIPPRPSVQVPAVIPSVDALVQDATALEHDAHVLRSRLELTTALNAGLTAHASVLHEELDALRDRAREGYNIGLDDRFGDCNPDGHRLRVLQLEFYRYTDLSGNEVSRAIADLSSLEASVTALRAQIGSLTRERDSALAANIRHRDQRDSMVSELCDARNAVARSRRELDVARVANVPLQDNLRRVNALLVAHAEEHQRDVTRVRDLEASSSVAETARPPVTTQALLLPATSRADAFRVALVSSRRAASQRRTQAQDHERRLQARLVSLENALSRRRRTARVEIARLERLIDDSDRAYTERTLTWRRLLREARIGREAARQVRDALVGRLRDMVLAVGGSLDVTALVRQLEGRLEAAVHAAIPLPPDLDPEVGRAAATLSGLPASTGVDNSRPPDTSLAA